MTRQEMLANMPNENTKDILEDILNDIESRVVEIQNLLDMDLLDIDGISDLPDVETTLNLVQSLAEDLY